MYQFSGNSKDAIIASTFVKRNTLQNDDNSSNYETLLEIILDSHVLK